MMNEEFRNKVAFSKRKARISLKKSLDRNHFARQIRKEVGRFWKNVGRFQKNVGDNWKNVGENGQNFLCFDREMLSYGMI